MSSQIQQTLPTDRSRRLAEIQRAVANMSSSEYLAFMEKIRSRIQRQHIFQQSQAQLPHELSALILQSHFQPYPTSQHQYITPELFSQQHEKTQTMPNFSNTSVPSFSDLGTSPLASSGYPYLPNQYHNSTNSQNPFRNMLKQNAHNQFLSPYITSDNYLQSLNHEQNHDVPFNFSDSLATPIFPADGNDKGLSMVSSSSQKKTHNFPVDFSRFDLLPSPLSAYTPSPALTSFESNASEFDPTDGAMFPLSVNTSPYLANLRESTIIDAPPSLFENFLPSKVSTHDIPELTVESPLFAENTLKYKDSKQVSPFAKLAGLSIDNFQAGNDVELFNSNLSGLESLELASPIREKENSYLIKAEDKSESPVGFVLDKEDDENDAYIPNDGSDDESERRIKKEPNYDLDAPLIKMEYDEYDSDELPVPPNYGEKRLPGTIPIVSQRRPSKVIVKPEFPADEFTDITESDDKDGRVSDEDEDYEMASEICSESDAEFSESSDDEFSNSTAAKPRRRSSTKYNGLKLNTSNMKISKSKAGSYVCPTCSKDFNRRFNLLTHLKTHEVNRPRPFTCPNCAATFVRQHDLTRHASVHATSKPHKCPGCQTQFSRRDAMLRHVMQRSKCSKAAEKAEKEAVDLINQGSGDLGVTAAAAGLSRGRGRRRKSIGLSIQKTEIQLLHEDPEAKKVIDEAIRMQKELTKKNKKTA